MSAVSSDTTTGNTFNWQHIDLNSCVVIYSCELCWLRLEKLEFAVLQAASLLVGMRLANIWNTKDSMAS